MKDKIIDYYEYTIPFYRIFWYRNKDSYALHYGLWERDTNSLQEALLNTNKIMSKIARIKKDDNVLDAGCGIGGSSIWLAKNEVKVTALNISERQLEIAKELAQKNQVNISFHKRDYTKTNLKKDTFDVVWAIESVCHAENKADFVKEAYRVLKKGGKMIIADAFLNRAPTKNEEDKLEAFYRGFALPNLQGINSFFHILKKQGFSKIRFIDKTREILPSSRRMYFMCVLAYPFSWIGDKMGIFSKILTKNILAGIIQYRMVKNRLLKYGIFYAEK